MGIKTNHLVAFADSLTALKNLPTTWGLRLGCLLPMQIFVQL